MTYFGTVIYLLVPNTQQCQFTKLSIHVIYLLVILFFGEEIDRFMVMFLMERVFLIVRFMIELPRIVS